jgi:uncharacterized membrane protein
MARLASVIEGQQLLKVIWVSAAAGVGVTAAFAVALLGASRALDLSRDGRQAEATLYGALGAVALVVVVAAIVFGIVVMTQK